jgi:DNA polymerase-1
MERSGITLDTDLLAGMSRRYGEQLSTIEGDIYESVGHQFNINSPKQLGSVLFEEIELPTARRKGGTYSTAAPVLEALRDVHPVVGLVLDYRQLSKLKSTYIDALPTLVNQKTGRVHTSFNQTRTATGRLSSSDPNLQNIPVRGSEARQIREAFIAPPGCLLLSADYSQIDLRSLAHLSQDEALLAAFRHDDDIHSATAARLYGVALNEVTADMRRLAKTVNFGVIYGMSEFGLQQAAELSREEAAGFIEAYFERYPGIRQYLESTKEQARRQGYVETMLRRKRTIAEINSSNRQVREGAERMAINMPVQGTSADIIKVAMVNVYREMGRRGLASRMLLQVHDELMFEVPEGEIDEMLEMVPRLMSTALELSVPLKVDTKTGRTWGGME